MDGNIAAFLIWCGIALLFIIMGIASFFKKKPMGFWANAEQFEVTDVKAYNKAVGGLFIAFGAVVAASGIPLLFENKTFILLSVLGMMIAVIAMMAVYMIIITPKFEKK